MAMTEKDWQRHELETLIRHHHQQAREILELAELFEKDGDSADKADAATFRRFSRARLDRATVLQRELAKLGD